MTDIMDWQKGKKELTEESTGDGRHGRKKRERLFKKRFSRLSLFSGSPKNKFPQGRSPLAEDQRRFVPTPGSGRPRAVREEPRSRRQQQPCSPGQHECPRSPGPPQPRRCSPRQRSQKMCGSCELRLCRPCGTLHSQRGFIAHSLLDHYDTAALPC